jgi:hypothetical protein
MWFCFFSSSVSRGLSSAEAAAAAAAAAAEEDDVDVVTAAVVEGVALLASPEPGVWLGEEDIGSCVTW